MESYKSAEEALGNLVTGWRACVDADEAHRYLLTALREFRAAEDADRSGANGRWLGRRLSEVGESESALEAYAASENAFVVEGQVEEAAECAGRRARLLARLGRWEEAASVFLHAALLMNQVGDGRGEAVALEGQGGAEASCGRWDRAASCFSRAAGLFDAMDDSARAARCLRRNAEAELELGHAGVCLEGLREAAQRFRDLDDVVSVADCDRGAGAALVELGQYGEAEDRYAAAYATYTDHRELGRMGRCSLAQAELAASRGRPSEAYALYIRAADELRCAGDTRALVLCDVGRAEALRAQGLRAEAHDLLEHAETQFLAHGDVRGATNAALNRGLVLRDLGLADKAEALLRATAADFERLGDPLGLAFVRLGLARLLAEQGGVQESIDLLVLARSVFAAWRRPYALVRVDWALGKALQNVGKADEALASYLSACKLLENLLARTRDTDIDASGLRAQLPDPFGPAILLCVAAAERHDADGDASQAASKRRQAFLLAERFRAAGFRMELAHAVLAQGLDLGGLDPGLLRRRRELEQELARLDQGVSGPGGGDLRGARSEVGGERERIVKERDELGRRLYHLDPEASALLDARVPTLAQMASTLRPDEGLCSYLFHDDDLIVMLLERTGVVRTRVLRSVRSELERVVSRLEQNILSIEAAGGRVDPVESDWQDELRSLGEILLDPAYHAGWFEGDKGRLTFVPCGLLHSLPWAALGVPGATSFTPQVRQLDVVVSPQAATRFFQDRKRGVVGKGTVAILNPDGSLGSKSAAEAFALSSAFPDVELYTEGEPVSARRFPEVVRGKSRVHITSHGRFEPHAPLESALVLAPEDGRATYLSARDLYALPDRFSLVMAAACETGEHEVLAGEALMGLSRALLYVSCATVTTLWRVQDHATAALTGLFYQRLAQGRDPAAALSAAQRVFLDPRSVVHRDLRMDMTHPYYWAGLSLLG